MGNASVMGEYLTRFLTVSPTYLESLVLWVWTQKVGKCFSFFPLSFLLSLYFLLSVWTRKCKFSICFYFLGLSSLFCVCIFLCLSLKLSVFFSLPCSGLNFINLVAIKSTCFLLLKCQQLSGYQVWAMHQPLADGYIRLCFLQPSL